MRETNARRSTAPRLASTSWTSPVGGRVHAVVEAAEDVGPPEVALLEGDQHLVADLGQISAPRSLPAPGCTVRAQPLT